MIHLGQGFEADFQISRMVPGLVKQGNHQVPGWETSLVLSLLQALQRLQSLCLSLHPANEAAGRS